MSDSQKPTGARSSARGLIYEHVERLGSHDLLSAETVEHADGQVTIQAYLNPDGRRYEAGVSIDSGEFLDLVARARAGEEVQFGTERDGLQLSSRSMTVRSRGDLVSFSPEFNFDALFLDSFSVIENSEGRRRSELSIELGAAERCLLEIVHRDPDLMRSMSPREFEVLCGTALANAGFSDVRVTRYSKDSGIDIYCFYAEGERENVVVVEAKHLGDAVGLSIVDRLAGVRYRKRADKGLVMTSSHISRDARLEYEHVRDEIALADFSSLTDLLAADSRWSETPGGLWSLKRASDE